METGRPAALGLTWWRACRRSCHQRRSGVQVGQDHLHLGWVAGILHLTKVRWINLVRTQGARRWGAMPQRSWKSSPWRPCRSRVAAPTPMPTCRDLWCVDACTCVRVFVCLLTLTAFVSMFFSSDRTVCTWLTRLACVWRAWRGLRTHSCPRGWFVITFPGSVPFMSQRCGMILDHTHEITGFKPFNESERVSFVLHTYPAPALDAHSNQMTVVGWSAFLLLRPVHWDNVLR